jgi:hypothetical protein
VIELVIGFLILLNVVQSIYWMKVCYGLNNRLMSRNYYEYNQAEALKVPNVPKHPVSEEIDFDAERQARDINSLMGVV